MGGYKAYRYHNRYYRRHIGYMEYPSFEGHHFARQIPADAAARAAWVKQVSRNLGAPAKYVESGNRRPYPGSELYEITYDHQWMAIAIDGHYWTYVIDLDHRAFTVNSQIHFNLDNMPPRISDYIYDDGTVQRIPKGHLTTVSQWPDPDIEADAARKSYDALQPFVTTLEEWGAPTWDTLSLAQHVSVALVERIVADDEHELARQDISSQLSMIPLHCWKIACAAAPSHLFCPPENAISLGGSIYGRITYQQVHRWAGWERHQSPPYRVRADFLTFMYCWFRGCLITICTRLDQAMYVKHEIYLMVEKLRIDGRSSGIGIILSATQMVAVVVNGAGVCHSPTLEVHDGHSIAKDGLLLLMHLLSPALTVQKTPWAPCSSIPVARTHSVLPVDIIRQIVHLTDNDTHHFVLPLVSRDFRSICFQYPRVGNYVLLGADRDWTFKALRSIGTSMVETYATLTRTSRRQIHDRLLCAFQHHQTGRGRIEVLDEFVKKQLMRPDRGWGDDCLWLDVIVKRDLPEMRIQVVEGTWSMVELAQSFHKESEGRAVEDTTEDKVAISGFSRSYK